MTRRCGDNDKRLAQFFEGVQTLPAMLARRAQLSPSASAFFVAHPQAWTPVSWGDFHRQVCAVAGRFARAGIRPGMRVGILGGTALGWETAQHALFRCGAVVCGIDPYYPDPVLNRVIERLELTHLVVDGASTMDRLTDANRARCIIGFLGDLGTAGANGAFTVELDARAPALVALSSGSTGDPEPTTYSHAQVVHACRSILELYPEVSPTSPFVCWLPLANLFQRMVNFCAMANGGACYVVEDPRRVMEVLPIANPQVLVAVPRFCEKLHGGVMQRLAANPLGAWLVACAMSLVAPLRQHQAGSRPLPTFKRLAAGLADRAVLRKLRAPLGDEIKFIVTGAAPTPRWLLDWFEAVGVPVLEAYGASENIVPIAANRLSARRRGTVGQPVGDNEIRIAEDGEVQVRGRGVVDPTLAGNHGRARALTADGFLATGDLGSFDEEGFLTLHGRRTEAYKNDQGRWVSLPDIEAALRQLPDIEQAVVVRMPDDRLLGVLTLTSPSTDGLGSRLARQIANLPRAMRPAGFLVVRAGFLPATGELTSSLKLRRAAIFEKYASSLRRLADALDKTPPQQEDVLLTVL